MSRSTRLLVLALAALGLALPQVAVAADPIPTTTRVFLADGAPGTTVVTTRVSSDAGVPAGSVVLFNTGSSDPLGPPVALDASGAATQTVPTGTGISPYRAEFTGTGGYADSVGSPNPFGEWTVMKPEPTILRIGGPTLLKLTLTFATRITYLSDGRPGAGEKVLFTLRNVARGASGHPEMSPNYVPPVAVCTAVADATGYATCQGTASQSSLVTLLTTPAYANHALFPVYESVKLPPISIG